MTIEVELQADILENVDGVPAGPLRMALRYDPCDPYAIQAVFHGNDDQDVTWTFARDLLEAGCFSKVGEGDVKVWPGPAGVYLRIESNEGSMLLSLPRRDVRKFLRRAFALVQSGHESEHLGLEAALTKLVAEA